MACKKWYGVNDIKLASVINSAANLLLETAALDRRALNVLLLQVAMPMAFVFQGAIYLTTRQFPP